jgi:hypothetical protein
MPQIPPYAKVDNTATLYFYGYNFISKAGLISGIPKVARDNLVLMIAE